jgi:hypothetical protein
MYFHCLYASEKIEHSEEFSKEVLLTMAAACVMCAAKNEERIMCPSVSYHAIRAYARLLQKKNYVTDGIKQLWNNAIHLESAKLLPAIDYTTDREKPYSFLPVIIRRLLASDWGRQNIERYQIENIMRKGNLLWEAWSNVTSSFFFDIFLFAKPEQIAIACVHLAIKRIDENRCPWFGSFGVTQDCWFRQIFEETEEDICKLASVIGSIDHEQHSKLDEGLTQQPDSRTDLWKVITPSYIEFYAAPRPNTDISNIDNIYNEQNCCMFIFGMCRKYNLYVHLFISCQSHSTLLSSNVLSNIFF